VSDALAAEEVRDIIDITPQSAEAPIGVAGAKAMLQEAAAPAAPAAVVDVPAEAIPEQDAGARG
jgi:hypothetical protein